MSVGSIASLNLQRPTGPHGARTFMEANPGKENRVAREGELTRGQSVQGSAQALARRRIARPDRSEMTAQTRSQKPGEEDDFAKLSRIASLLEKDEDETAL